MMMMSHVVDQHLSEYERERNLKINQNLRFLKDLGFERPFLSEIHPNLAHNPRKRKKDNESHRKGHRQSNRVRGIAAPSVECPVAVSVPESVSSVERGRYSHSLWRGKPHRNSRALIPGQEPLHVTTPLTLGSIGTTIEATGQLKTGDDEALYWSTTGCLYHHPYPIGWKASKLHFGKLYHMEVKEGPPGNGPIFEVYEEGGSVRFQGNTPTKPWTEVCLRSKSVGTRVSGPLFFGFSDPLSQKLIRMLMEEKT